MVLLFWSNCTVVLVGFWVNWKHANTSSSSWKKIVSNDKYFLLEKKWTQSVAYVFECLYWVCHSDSVGYNDKNIAMNDMCFRQQNPQAHSLSIFKIALSFLSIGSIPLWHTTTAMQYRHMDMAMNVFSRQSQGCSDVHSRLRVF